MSMRFKIGKGMEYIQLELFPVSETDQLRAEIHLLKKELANVRKGMFARQNQLNADLVQLRKDVDQLLNQQQKQEEEIHEKIC